MRKLSFSSNDHPHMLDVHYDLMSVSHFCPLFFLLLLFVHLAAVPKVRIMRVDVALCGLIMSKCLRGEMRKYRCWRVRGPLSVPALSVHSNPCPAAQHSDRAAVTACRPMPDLHTPSVPKQADVSLCQPPWSDALLRQLKAAQGHTCVRGWGLNFKQRANGQHPANITKQKGSAEVICQTIIQT